MSKVDYYAGFFDGEGSIGIYRNGRGAWHLRTQLTQNISPETTALLTEMRDLYGGNLATMHNHIYRGGGAYNWQLNGEGAADFLLAVVPSLRLKQDQAMFAIAWQKIHPRPSRDACGRMVAHDRNRPIDLDTARLLKALKRAPLAAVMAAQPDLVKVVTELRQVLCVKG